MNVGTAHVTLFVVGSALLCWNSAQSSRRLLCLECHADLRNEMRQNQNRCGRCVRILTIIDELVPETNKAVYHDD